MCVQHTEALKSILRFLSTLVNIELSIASVGRKLKYIFSSTNEIHIHFYALHSMQYRLIHTAPYDVFSLDTSPITD